MVKNKWLTGLFLGLEAVLYAMILTTGGRMLVLSSYGAIVLCFLYSLLHFKTGSRLLMGGAACTVAADFCLVILSPAEKLWGMIFFLMAQSLYAAHLHKSGDKRLLSLRLGLIAALVITALLVLKDKTDLLALVSVCYYANLIINILATIPQKPTLTVAFVLFLLCDTVIGLQVAAGGYLPIPEGSWLHRLLFMDFNLSWFFYLPSQVLIALNIKNSA